MWILFLVLTISLWSVTSIFYKKGANKDDRYIHLKFSIVTGIVFLLIAIIYLIIRDESFSIWKSMIRFWPVTAFGIIYAITNTITFKGYIYNKSSINAPIENTANGSYVILLIILFLVFGRIESIWDVVNGFKIAGIVCIFIGLLMLGIVQHNIAKKEHKKENFKAGATALIFPIVFSLMDGLETIVSGLCLDSKFGFGMSEGDAIIILGLEYAVIALGLWIFVSIKQKKVYNPICKSNAPLLAGSLCDNVGIVCYAYAMAIDSVSTDPILAVYPVITVLLSKILLHEKLTAKQYICIFIMILGSVMMVIGHSIL